MGDPEKGSHFTNDLIDHIKKNLYQPFPDIFNSLVYYRAERKVNFQHKMQFSKPKDVNESDFNMYK